MAAYIACDSIIGNHRRSVDHRQDHYTDLQL
ncbi:hypothetical protein DESC_610232 [Desulfosarcina cetonica]|nr:hypothetical protein DESC_610232 [Desulfosarcina cetonica]